MRRPVGLHAQLKALWDAAGTAPSGEGGVGTEGPEGPQGPQGEPGPKGDKGDPGDMGPQGNPGIAGTPGAKGDTGAEGPKGDPGLTGQQGIPGERGLQGEAGTLGPKGDAGTPGTTGLKGDTGEQGIQGVQGPQGIQGLKGDKGDQGIQGLQGVKGDTGSQGPQGIPGTSGDPWSWAKLSADVSNTTTTLAASGLSFTAAANTTYIVELIGTFTSSLATAGIAAALDIPSGSVVGQGYSPISATASGSFEQIADNATTGATASVRAAGTLTPVGAQWIVAIGATGGAVQLTFRPEVAATCTLKANLTALRSRSI